MLVQLPPYAIPTPVFRFRALAMHAGRAALGGDREVALTCFAVARLAAGTRPPFMLAAGDVATRCAAAKQWVASLALPTNTRNGANAVIDAVAAGNRRGTASSMKHLVEVATAQLDQGSINELNELVTELSAA